MWTTLKNILKKCSKHLWIHPENNSSRCYQINFSTQTDSFYSYQCNEPIFKVNKWSKSYEKLLQTFYSFCEKSCVATPTFQLDIHSIRLRRGRFFNILIDFINTNAMNPFSFRYVRIVKEAVTRQNVLQIQRKFIKDEAYRMKVCTEVYFFNLNECALQFWPFIWYAIFQKQLNDFANWFWAELRFAHSEKQYLKVKI